MSDVSQRSASSASLVELRFLEGIARRVPDDHRVLRPLGDLYTQVGRYADGLAVDRRLVSLCPDDAEVWYNLGCSLALVGDRDQAFDTLDQAVRHGYHDADWMSRDEDLATLRDDPRFTSLIARLRKEA